ncbi:MAG: hypothetical protein R3E64_14470 [Halioglobus sp.]
MLKTIAAVLIITASVMLWQQWRYLRIRRNYAQDRQHQLHPGGVFHVIVFFKLKSGSRVIDCARRYTQQVISGSKARLIYAGQAAFTMPSEQLGDRQWDGVLLFEYRSRAAFEEVRNTTESKDARALFADSYLHGMRRNRKTSAAVPQYLLRRLMKLLLRGEWRVPPLEASSQFETAPELELWRSRVSRLRALQKINREGLVVFNLVKYSNAGSRGTVESFGSRLIPRMAALAYGPLHLGRSVALEEFARYDRVFVVYYPSAHYLAELISSQYFQNFIDSALVSDTLWVPTVPITERL